MALHDAEEAPHVLTLQVLLRTGFPLEEKPTVMKKRGVCVCSAGADSDSKATLTGLFNPMLPL